MYLIIGGKEERGIRFVLKIQFTRKKDKMYPDHFPILVILKNISREKKG